MRLLSVLFVLTLNAAVITVIINQSAGRIALASVLGFTAAQIFAGIFYQRFKNSQYFYKVNLSDLIAITCDSIVFQLVAFNHFDTLITLGQITIKFAGGLLWYFILFKKLKLDEKINCL